MTGVPQESIMKSHKNIRFISVIILLLLSSFTYLCAHSVRNKGWISVVMYCESEPVNRDIAGKTFPLDSKSQINITTISRDVNADGTTERFRIHANILGVSKRWFSMRDRSWNHIFVASSSRAEEELRSIAGFASDSITELKSDMLQP